MNSDNLIAQLKSLENKKEAIFLKQFFKCGKGEYAEGDEFLGIRVHVTRRLIKGYENILTPEAICILVKSPYHEIRLAGLLIWVKQMQEACKKNNLNLQKKIYDLYWKHTSYINNWDLVDLSSRDIVGCFLYHHQREKSLDILLQKIADNNLWKKRIAIVSTYYFIQQKEYFITYEICKALMYHKHDLIHKACGWMIRETGKRIDAQIMKNFVEKQATKMPRTMLRYAIEHCNQKERKYFMSL